MFRRSAVLLLVASAIASLAACTQSSSGSPSTHPTTSPSKPSPAAANAAAGTYRTQLTAWSKNLTSQMTTLRFAQYVSPTKLDSAKQEAGERAACTGATAALHLLATAPQLATADASGSPTYAKAQQTQHTVDAAAATLKSDLTQYGTFCRLYVKLLDITRQDDKLYDTWLKKYTHTGSTTWHGTTYNCDSKSRCLIPDQSKNDASAALYRRAHQFDYTDQGPSPFAGAAWAKLWAAFQSDAAASRAADDRYIAALRYYQGKPPELHGSAGNKVDAAIRYTTKHQATARMRLRTAAEQSGLFPATVLKQAAKHSTQSTLCAYQMRQLEGQMRQLAGGIAKQ